MKNRRISLRPWAIMCLLACSLVGCSDEPPICPAVAGRFQPLYQLRGQAGNPTVAATTCQFGPDPYMVQVDNNIFIEKQPNIEVETETIVKGCTVYMQQTIRNRNTGYVTAKVQGSTLEVEGSDQLSGMVTLTRYPDPANPASQGCMGEYNLTLVRPMNTLGGAAM